MLNSTYVADTFFVIKLLSHGTSIPSLFMRFVNDCAWHTTGSVESATRLEQDQVEGAIKEIEESGFKCLTALKVEKVYRTYTLPKAVKSHGDSYDWQMSVHPLGMNPRLALDIINLKTAYSIAPTGTVADKIKKNMAECVEKYENTDTACKPIFCPICNKVEDGMVVTPETFGHFMLYKKYGASDEGYECERCHHQKSHRIEHWG